MKRTFRPLTIKISRAYRTVSDEALDELSKIPPMDLLLLEHKTRFDANNAKLAEEQMLEKWRSRWNSATGKAVWTKRLIPDLDPWISCRFAKVGFNTTQLLTGHGTFADYLHRFKIRGSDKCTQCDQQGTAEHVIYSSKRWKREREREGLEEFVGSLSPPEELMNYCFWLVGRTGQRLTNSRLALW